MMLFKSSKGFIISAGFDMLTLRVDPNIICWSDPVTGSWEAAEGNLSGWNRVDFPVYPEFIRESSDGTICLYQPGQLIEMIPTDPLMPFLWSFRRLIAND